MTASVYGALSTHPGPDTTLVSSPHRPGGRWGRRGSETLRGCSEITPPGREGLGMGLSQAGPPFLRPSPTPNRKTSSIFCIILHKFPESVKMS